MTTARNSTFTLKPQEKDFDNMSNMLEFAKSTKSVIRLINPQKFPSDETYRVQNYTSDSDKDFLVIAVLS